MRKIAVIIFIEAACVVLFIKYWRPQTPDLSIGLKCYLRTAYGSPIAWLNVTNNSNRNLDFIGEIYEPTSGRVICDYRQWTKNGWTNWTFNGHRDQDTWVHAPTPFFHEVKAGAAGTLGIYLPTNGAPTEVWVWARESEATNQVVRVAETLVRKIGLRSELKKIRIPFELTATNFPPMIPRRDQIYTPDQLPGLFRPLEGPDIPQRKNPLFPE